VPVQVEHRAGKVIAGGELALEGLRGAAVEKVAAAALPEDCHVAERGRAAEVQAPAQRCNLCLIDEYRSVLPAVLGPDDGASLDGEVL